MLKALKDSPWTGAAMSAILVLWEGFLLIGPPLGLTTHEHPLYVLCGVIALEVCFFQSFFAFRREVRALKSQIYDGRPIFALEVRQEAHSYDPVNTEYFAIRNCGVRAARQIRFDPIESKQGSKFTIDGLPSLTTGERKPLGFHVGTGTGLPGHLVNFFGGGSSNFNEVSHSIVIRFIDGMDERTELHTLYVAALPKGGISMRAEITSGQVSTSVVSSSQPSHLPA